MYIKTIKSILSSRNTFYQLILLSISILFLYILLSYSSIINISLYNFIFILVFVLLFLICIKIFSQILIIQNNYKKINQELPFFINNLCNDLDKGIDFKHSLENRVLDNSIISKDIKKALNLTKSGKYSISESLLLVSKENIILKEFIIQLIEIINFGSKNRSYSLKVLSNTIIRNQNLNLKNFSTKLNFITLLYIIFSSIIPAMLLIFFIIGSNFFELDFSNIQIIFIITVFLPLLNMGLLFFIKNITP